MKEAKQLRITSISKTHVSIKRNGMHRTTENMQLFVPLKLQVKSTFEYFLEYYKQFKQGKARQG